MKKKSSKAQSKYDENLSTLYREVTNYKHIYFKKETRKVIKTKHFLKYFESCNNSFMNTPLDLVWNNNYLTPNFLEDISSIEYDDIIPLIIQLLIGDFQNTIKKKKLVDLRKPNQKICSFYFLPLNNNVNKNILFALCLKGKYSPSSSIHFLSISSNWDFEEKALEFLEEINNNNDEFPLVDFDKNGIYLVDEILFSHKEKDKFSDRIICYPLKNISIHNVNYNVDDFMTNQLNESIINQIEDNQYEPLIISAIEGGYWDYKLSLQEKKYVKNSDSFILSGRPGTGKTTVILFKLFSIYFNYILKKKNRLNDFNKLKTNNNNKINKTTKSLRVVFTSLSQPLCEKQQKIFEETMVRKIDELESDYFPISNDGLKLMSSFIGLSEYPIFANFRKIMFMIDGSLNSHFFNSEGDHNTKYFYSKNYIYDVNKYSFNENYN